MTLAHLLQPSKSSNPSEEYLRNGRTNGRTIELVAFGDKRKIPYIIVVNDDDNVTKVMDGVPRGGETEL